MKSFAVFVVFLGCLLLGGVYRFFIYPDLAASNEEIAEAIAKCPFIKNTFVYDPKITGMLDLRRGVVSKSELKDLVQSCEREKKGALEQSSQRKFVEEIK